MSLYIFGTRSNPIRPVIHVNSLLVEERRKVTQKYRVEVDGVKRRGGQSAH